MKSLSKIGPSRSVLRYVYPLLGLGWCFRKSKCVYTPTTLSDGIFLPLLWDLTENGRFLQVCVSYVTSVITFCTQSHQCVTLSIFWLLYFVGATEIRLGTLWSSGWTLFVSIRLNSDLIRSKLFLPTLSWTVRPYDFRIPLPVVLRGKRKRFRVEIGKSFTTWLTSFSDLKYLIVIFLESHQTGPKNPNKWTFNDENVLIEDKDIELPHTYFTFTSPREKTWW